ncbi:MAG: radical SAM protein [Candidatus Nanoarchaeia archaeon]|nr:radical SAM protein [Candidatus Nanoarchaeia archaeon]
MLKENRLNYNPNVWVEVHVAPVNTLQVFITNKCNLRCEGCFYEHGLGKEEMSVEEYKGVILNYKNFIQKVTLLGGEPTLHENLEELIDFNNKKNLRTTIYTNGAGIKRLEKVNLLNTSVRIGVYGSYSSEKPLSKVKKVNFPLTVLYMLRKDNIDELMETALMAENYSCEKFFISSIRDVADTGSYWKDNDSTIPLEEYASVIQDFVNNYNGNIKELHISNRGVIYGKNKEQIPECRFLSIFPNKKEIICPFDISLEKYSKGFAFDYTPRKCDKHTSCLLSKMVLRRR